MMRDEYVNLYSFDLEGVEISIQPTLDRFSLLMNGESLGVFETEALAAEAASAELSVRRVSKDIVQQVANLDEWDCFPAKRLDVRPTA